VLKPGDHVAIDGDEQNVGVVKEVHPHEVVVRKEDGTHERLALESVRLLPTMGEASGYVDH
jgi:ferredoxin-fold anticodon binding domain-containing protein